MDRAPQQSRGLRRALTELLREGELISDRYRVVRRVGEGAYGTVYEVEHIALGKRFALKVLNHQSRQNWRTISRFQAEAVTASKIDHPNIVSITDVGRTANDQAYYVMELLEGETLSDVLRRDKIVSLSRALPILAATAHGLHAAHEAGVIHRDLKPENIFLVPSEDPQSGRNREIVRILDFGLAKVVEAPGVTIDGITYGTPGYMAPEQIRGEEVDRRADIYSIGCIAYEMISGRPLFVGPPLEVALAHCEEDPPTLSLPPSPRFKWVIERCLEKEPSKRFQNCHELLQELRECAIELLTPEGKTRAISLTPTPLETPGARDSWASLSDSDDQWWEEFSSVVQNMGGGGSDEITPLAEDSVVTPDPAKTLQNLPSTSATLIDEQQRFGSEDRPTDVAPKHGFGELEPVTPSPLTDLLAGQPVKSPTAPPIAPPIYQAQEHTLQVDPSQAKDPGVRSTQSLALALVAVAAAVAVLLAAVLYKIVTQEPRTGALIVNIQPKDALIKIANVPQTSKGPMRVFNDLPAGKTIVRATFAGCVSKEETVLIRAGRVQVAHFKLRCQ